MNISIYSSSSQWQWFGPFSTPKWFSDDDKRKTPVSAWMIRAWEIEDGMIKTPWILFQQ